MTAKDYRVIAAILALYEVRLRKLEKKENEEWVSAIAEVVTEQLEHLYKNFDFEKFTKRLYDNIKDLEKKHRGE